MIPTSLSFPLFLSIYMSSLFKNYLCSYITQCLLFFIVHMKLCSILDWPVLQRVLQLEHLNYNLFSSYIIQLYNTQSKIIGFLCLVVFVLWTLSQCCTTMFNTDIKYSTSCLEEVPHMFTFQRTNLFGDVLEQFIKEVTGGTGGLLRSP